MRVAKSNVVAGMMVALALTAATSANAAVDITSGRTRNMQCEAGACVPTKKNADLNVGDLVNMLKSSDVTVYTGHGAVTIEVTAPLTWTSSNRLTLNAYSSVSFKAPVVSEGSGGMTIVTNVQGLGGELRFFEGGSVSFWDTNSSLVIDGVTYTLMNSIPTLASAIAANPSGNYALANDYNAFVDGVYLHAPVTTPLAGIFHGLGHTVDSLEINDTTLNEDVGLFARLLSGAHISNVSLTNFNINVSSGQKGGLVGTNLGDIANVSASGGSGNFDGAIAAANGGTIEHAQAVINGTGAALAGSNSTVIYDCHVSGSNVGGGSLAGINWGRIIGSSSTADIIVSYEGQNVAGGLVQENLGGSIEQSFATGSLSMPSGRSTSRAPHGTRGWGGLVGYFYGTIRDSYSTGSVNPQGSATVGGLVGYMERESTIERSYSTGAVVAKRKFVGGLLGFDDNPDENIVESTYWDLDTSGINDKSKGAGNIVFHHGIKGLTTQMFKSSLPAGFDPAVWGQNASINNGYPYLLANPPEQ